MLFNLSRTFAAFFVFTVLIFSAHGADSLECESLLQQAENPATQLNWSTEGNVFADSLPSTLASTVVWMSAVEAVRQIGFHDEPSITPTFLRTVPTDAALTVISHAIAIGNFPRLKRFLSAEGLGKRFEFWGRAATNGILSTAVISTAWALSGIHLQPEHVVGAFGLCAGVYPVLQAVKGFLFKRFPFLGDRSAVERIERDSPTGASELFEAVHSRMPSGRFSEEEQQALQLNAVEELLTSRPYERAIAADPYLSRQITVRVDATSIKDLMKQRRTLLNAILQVEERTTDPALRARIHQILDLGQPFVGDESITFHRVFRDRFKSYRRRLYIASFLDQAVAVGLAGGVFLYSTTYWAANGHWPW